MRLVCPALAALALASTLSAAEEITFAKPAAGDPLQILVGGELFTAFRTDTRVPCLYPLISPSGANLTRHFPLKKGVADEANDHPHHTSFWFTHGSVNGHDFWHDPDCRIVNRKGSTTRPGEGTKPETGHGAVLTTELEWIAKDEVILSEKRRYLFDSRGKTRTVTVISTLTPADGDVTFGDTKEGSFAIRLTPTLRLKGKVAKGHSINSEGVKDNACWGKRAKWVAYHGPDAGGEPAVVAIMDHPKNLRHPTWWHARDYGLVAANPFGIHHFEKKKDKTLGNHTIKKGESLTFTYRLVLHHGSLDSLDVEKEWKDFAKE